MGESGVLSPKGFISNVVLHSDDHCPSSLLTLHILDMMRKSSRETKRTEVFSFPEASSSRIADSDDEDFGMDSSQSIAKPANKKTKEPTLFDKYKSGGSKAVEIIGKSFFFLLCSTLLNPCMLLLMHRCCCVEPQLDPRCGQMDKQLQGIDLAGALSQLMKS